MKKLPTLQKSPALGGFRNDNPLACWRLHLGLKHVCVNFSLFLFSYERIFRHFNVCALMKQLQLARIVCQLKKQSHTTARAVCFSFSFHFFHTLFCILAHRTIIRDAGSQSLFGVHPLPFGCNHSCFFSPANNVFSGSTGCWRWNNSLSHSRLREK